MTLMRRMVLTDQDIRTIRLALEVASDTRLTDLMAHHDFDSRTGNEFRTDCMRVHQMFGPGGDTNR